MKHLVSFVVAILYLAAPVQSAASTVINVWFNTQNTGAQQVMNDVLIPEFESEYPNIDVRYAAFPWQERTDRLAVAFAGGVAPDVYEIGSDTIVSDLAGGFPSAMDRYISSWEGRDSFIPEAWLPSRWNGVQYGVPFTLTGRHLFYYTGVFEEAGLDGEAAPVDWEALESYTRKLLVSEPDGTITRLGSFLGWPHQQSMYWFWWQNGAEIVDEETGKALFNSPEGIEALTFWSDLYKMQGLPGPTLDFYNGEIGIRYMSTHVMVRNTLDRAPERFEELRMFVPERKGKKVWPLYVNSLGITSQSKRRDEAWAFIEWFSRPENAIRYLEEVGILTPNFEAIQTDYIQNRMRPVQGLYTEAKHARRTFMLPSTQVNGMVRGYLEKVLKSEMSVEEAIQQAEFEWNAMTGPLFD